MTKKEEDAVLAFLDRIINGRKLDDFNHDNDSMREVADELQRRGLINCWAANVCGNVYNEALDLRKLILGV